jgi:isopentenyl-diphosphate delta-isomerase
VLVPLLSLPNATQAVRYVTLPQLQQMMDPASGLSWSPWFRIIAAHFLPTWWADLPQVLQQGKHQDTATIHRLDCPTSS